MSGNTTILCINRISSLYGTFTSTEKKIADFVIANYEQVAKFTCAELAAATSTSPATVIRFSKKIGFDSYVEMKLSLSQQLIDQSTEIAAIKKTDTSAIVKQKVLKFNKDVIDCMNQTLDAELLERAADMLCKAKNILVIGDGGSGITARNAHDVFLQLQLPCDLISDPFFQILKIDQMNKSDVVFAVSNSGRSRNTLENLKHAHERNIPTIGIIGIPNSPMAQYLDIEVHTNIFNSQSFCDSVAARICELSVISVLHALIYRRLPRNSIIDIPSAYNRKSVKFGD